MFKKDYFNRLLWILLFTVAPLESMEIQPSNDEIVQFFDAIKNCALKKVEGILEKNPAIINVVDPDYTTTALEKAIIIDLFSKETNKRRPALVKLLLKYGAQIQPMSFIHSLTDIQGHMNCKNQIAHLLFSFGTKIDSGDDTYYKDDPESILKVCEFEKKNNKDLIEIIEAHICTRLYIAIEKGNAHEIRRLVQKYNLTIDNSLPCYNHISNYGTASALTDSKDMPIKRIVPLHYAVACKQEAIVHLLVDDLGADVNVRNENGQTVFDYEPNTEIMEFLLSKGAQQNTTEVIDKSQKKCITLTVINENSEEIDSIEYIYTNDTSEEISEQEEYIEENQVESIETEQAEDMKLEITQDLDMPNKNCEDPITSIEDINTIPSDNNDNNNNHNLENSPVDDQTILKTDSILPWKWIGYGIGAVAIIITAKQLYNWWHTQAKDIEDIEEEENNNIPQNDHLSIINA